MPYFRRGHNPLGNRHQNSSRGSQYGSNQRSREYAVVQCYSDDESSLREKVNRPLRTDSEYHSSQTIKHDYRRSPKHDNFISVVSKSSENTSPSTIPSKHYKHSLKQYDYSNSNLDRSYSCYSPEPDKNRLESAKPILRTYSSSKSEKPYILPSETSLRACSTHNPGHVLPQLPNSKIVEWDNDLRPIPLTQARRNAEHLYMNEHLKRSKRMSVTFYDEVDSLSTPSKRATHSNSFQPSRGVLYAQSKSISHLSSGPVATVLATPNLVTNTSDQAYKRRRPLHRRCSNPSDHISHSEEFDEPARGRSRTRQPIECTICQRTHTPDIECFAQLRSDSRSQNGSSFSFLPPRSATGEDRSFKTEANSKINQFSTTSSRSECYSTFAASPKDSSRNKNSDPKLSRAPSNLGYRTRIATPSTSEDTSSSARANTTRPTAPESCPDGQVDLYRVLDVASNASQGEIKKAYMELALVYHPDKVKGEEKKRLAQEKFIQVTEAYGTLGNEDKRATYDAEVRLETLRKMRKSES